jgi:hypothetical protein
MPRRARRATLPDPVRWRAPLGYLPKTLLQPRRPIAALVTAWLLAFPGSLALGVAARLLLPDAEAPQFAPEGALTLFLLVVFAPAIETLIMGAVLLVLVRIAGPSLAVILSAAGWGIAHSAAAPIWGLVIWWPFLIFSILFVAWRQRSLALAFAMPALAHALQNSIPALLIAFGVEA